LGVELGFFATTLFGQLSIKITLFSGDRHGEPSALWWFYAVGFVDGRGHCHNCNADWGAEFAGYKAVLKYEINPWQNGCF
jgi:hypothetical protein